MAKAAKAYAAEQAKSSSRKGAQMIAKEHGIAKQWQTIVNRYDSGRSIRDAYKDQQKLTSTEEAVLVDFLNQSADRGFPQMHRNISQYANCKGNPCYFLCSLYPSGVPPLSQTSFWSISRKPRNSRMLETTSGAFDTPSGTPSRHTTVQSTPTLFSVYVSCHPSRVPSEYSLWIIPC